MKWARAAALAVVALIGAASWAAAFPRTVTPPSEAFDQDPGSDYFIANYTAYERYLKRLAGESDRLKLVDMGRTSEGRTQWMAVVSSPDNLARLDLYKSIARRLAKAEGLDEVQARDLARRGKPIVWIDAGMHANESVPMQGQIHVLHRMLSADDPDTRRILDDVILLFVAANPDGMEIYGDWYMRDKDQTKRRRSATPGLWQRYAGHDNNRDYFMSHMAETTNINRALYQQWYPQLLLNQHQPSPEGSMLFVSPEGEPTSPRLGGLVLAQVREVGSAIGTRLAADGFRGAVSEGAASFDKWSSGMLNATARSHNIVSILTEIAGGATPERIGLSPDLQLPSSDAPLPIEPQLWHQRQTIDYQWSINREIMNYASRNKERLLLNAYRMAAAAIDQGSRDSWTASPAKVEALKKAKRALPADRPPDADEQLFRKIMRDPADRDPRAYILTADQRDVPTALTFLNALIKSGVKVERARTSFVLGGKRYPAGSWIVPTAQAYRAHVLEMFEPQHYPPTFVPEGPRRNIRDTGFTIAYQMGIAFDRVLDAFQGPVEEVKGPIAPAPGRIVGEGRAGWLIGHETNASFILTNRLLKAGQKVSWLRDAAGAGGRRFAPGTIWVPRSDRAKAIIERGTVELGISAYGAARQPGGNMLPLFLPRIGVFDRFGGVKEAGWLRWLLEQFEFPYETVYPQQIDAGSLRDRFDALVLADEAVITPASEITHPGRCCIDEPQLETIPERYRGWTGRISEEASFPQLETYLRRGGTLMAIGSSTTIADHLGISAEPALVKIDGGKREALDPREFSVPGSLLRIRLDPRQPLAYGMPEEADMFFFRSQSYRVPPGGPAMVAWFPEGDLLRSGLGIGVERLAGTAAILDVDVGRGKLFLVGPGIINRAQSFGTLKLLFNGLLYGPAAAKP